MSRILLRTSALTGASLLQMLALAVLSLLVARYLSIADFAVTRIVTAYMVFLTLAGHLCMHDAATAYAASAADAAERAQVVTAATVLTALIGCVIAVITVLGVLYSGYWSDPLRTTLAVVAACIPLVSLTTVYVALLQVSGSYRDLALNLALGGLLPLLIMPPSVAQWGLQGWIAGRVISYALLLGFAALCLRATFRQVGRETLTVARRLLHFARVQIISGALSMGLQSADVILLERLGAGLHEVAIYGMGVLLTRPIGLLPGALGRVLFRDIALEGHSLHAATKLLRWTAGACCGIALLLYALVPPLLRAVYGTRYDSAVPVTNVLLLGVLGSGVWTALSTINVAQKRPERAVAISVTGAATAAITLPLAIPVFGAVGAAWAMNAAYFAGSALGIWQLYAKGSSGADRMPARQLRNPL